MMRRVLQYSYVVLFLAMFTAPSMGQPAKAVVEDEIKIFYLKNVTPFDAQQVLESLLQQPQRIHFGTHPTANMLIARGPKDELKIVEAVLMTIDEAPVQQPAKSQLVHITLKHISASAFQQAALILSERPPLYCDDRTNSVVANATIVQASQLSNLVAKIDVPNRQSQKSVLLRLVWLVEKTGAAEGAQNVPADLNPTIEAVRKKMSLGELRTASQLTVLASVNGSSYQVSGIANLPESTQVRVTGSIMEDADGDKYLVRAQIDAQGVNANDLTASISTECSGIKIDHPIVVGTTSIKSQTSVFVIQIIGQ